MNSNPDTPCPICKDTFCSIVKHVGDRIHFECATCGVFAVAGTALSTILSLERENELSSVQRQQFLTEFGRPAIKAVNGSSQRSNLTI